MNLKICWDELLYVVLLTLMSCSSTRLTKEYRNTLQTNQHISIQGIERSYHLFNPSQKANSPIIFLFHGNGGSADNIAGLSHVKAPYIPWFDIAVNEGLILVIPDGTIGPKNSQGWNDCRNDAPRIPASDDVGFITTLLDTLKTSLRYDDRKVFMVGTSNGGHFVMRLAQEIPHRMIAFASIVASGPANSKCNTSTIPVSALFMNGTEDPLVPYLGGKTENGTVISTDSSIAYWVKRNGTQTTPFITEFPQKSSSKVISYRYVKGANDTEVMLYKIEGGGHIEPSRRERYSFLWTAFAGKQNGDIESAEEIWAFFKEKVRK
jgi:polyhydroxybutyrate depolymerase